jgi:hypothetical protein
MIFILYVLLIIIDVFRPLVDRKFTAAPHTQKNQLCYRQSILFCMLSMQMTIARTGDIICDAIDMEELELARSAGKPLY